MAGGGWGGAVGLQLAKRTKPKFKKRNVVDVMTSQVLHDFPFSRNLPLKLPDE
jgi:hypothetical protein